MPCDFLQSQGIVLVEGSFLGLFKATLCPKDAVNDAVADVLVDKTVRIRAAFFSLVGDVEQVSADGLELIEGGVRSAGDTWRFFHEKGLCLGDEAS